MSFKISKGLKRGAAFFVGFLMFAALWGLKLAPTEPYDYQTLDAYKETKSTVSQLSALDTVTSQVWKAGWSKENIVPDRQARIIGFGFKKKFEGVWDSLFVRSCTFSNSTKRFAIVSYDLLMVHPSLRRAVLDKVQEEDLDVDGVYFSATHTHNGYGGFGDGVVGYFVLGGHDEALIDFLAQQAVASLKSAIKEENEATIGATKLDMKGYVRNRVIENGETNDVLHLLEITRSDSARMCLWSFGAHATCLYQETEANLSADYPGEVNRILENTDEVDFSMFMAGSVGSQNPLVPAYFIKDKNAFATSIADSIQERLGEMISRPLDNVAFREVPISLQEPCTRLSKTLALNGNSFDLLFARSYPYVSEFKLNDVLMLGTPCDFNGLLAKELEQDEQNHIIITSFNGDYMGYVTPDEYYFTQSHREVWELNWYGYGNGGYFSEILQDLIDLE